MEWMIFESLSEARKLLDQDRFLEAHGALKPLLDKGVPEAEYLYSTFGFSNESDEEFEKRRLSLLKSSAKKNFPEAIYELGVMYDTGEIVIQNKIKASNNFMKAAQLGHPRSKLSYGLDLFYGSNGIQENKDLGLKYITEASEENVEGADEILKTLRNG